MNWEFLRQFWKGRRRPAQPSRPKARPGVETLETRDVPSASRLGLPALQPSAGAVFPAFVGPLPAAPAATPGGDATGAALRAAAKKGTIIVAVYEEPRRGVRHKLADITVTLIEGSGSEKTRTDHNGVARFEKEPYGHYTAKATYHGKTVSVSGDLKRSELRLEIVFKA